MKHGSLFSGIGGFDLAAEWMDWENVFHCEWNPFGQKVLKHYWPNATSYHDITKSDFTIHRGQIDILTGGFPCQPYSSAGKRLGKEDDRHLWPEMLRAIREIQPRWVVGENVRGLTNWNGGLVFDEVQADLESEGYEVTPFLLPAVAVGAPHRRDRIWIVAHNNRNSRGSKKWEFSTQSKQQRFSKEVQTIVSARTSPDAHSQQRCEGGLHKTRREATKRYAGALDSRNSRGSWQDFPTQPPVCSGNDGFSSRLDGITFSKWRNESIKAAGNAIVPQVVYQIFKGIQEYETNYSLNQKEI